MRVASGKKVTDEERCGKRKYEPEKQIVCAG
jgi:hypothetical protein